MSCGCKCDDLMSIEGCRAAGFFMGFLICRIGCKDVEQMSLRLAAKFGDNLVSDCGVLVLK
ncbi:hypothetical protein D3C86_2162590 [compost metagenome]